MKEIYDECPFCDKKHHIEVLQKEAKITLNGKTVRFTKEYCRCNVTGEEFVPAYMMDNNLAIAKKALQGE